MEWTYRTICLTIFFICLLLGSRVNSPKTHKLRMLTTDLSCSTVLLVDGLVYFIGQLAILMTLNYFSMHCPLPDLLLPNNRTCFVLFLFASQSKALVLVRSESLKLFGTHETTRLWIPLPLQCTPSQVMTSNHSGPDSTFTATFVLTAYADMKMALSVIGQIRNRWGLFGSIVACVYRPDSIHGNWNLPG